MSQQQARAADCADQLECEHTWDESHDLVTDDSNPIVRVCMDCPAVTVSQ